MSETLLDGKSISPSGSTTASFGMDRDEDEAVFIVRGDGNSSSLDFEVTEVAFKSSDNLVTSNFTASTTGVDATTDADNEAAFRISGLRGFGRGTLKVSNNAGSSTTITVEQAEY